MALEKFCPAGGQFALLGCQSQKNLRLLNLVSIQLTSDVLWI
jgi:hypothetical protein